MSTHLKNEINFTSRIVTTILQSFQSGDQQIDYLLPILGYLIVEVRENTWKHKSNSPTLALAENFHQIPLEIGTQF